MKRPDVTILTDDQLLPLVITSIDTVGRDLTPIVALYVKYLVERKQMLVWITNSEYKLRTRHEDLPHVNLRFEGLRDSLPDRLKCINDYGEKLVLDSKEPVDNVPFRRRFQDYVLRLSVVPCPKCCFCGDSVYNAALICTNTGRDNLDRNSKYPSVDTSGCTMKTDVKRRRVRLRTPGAEATKINDSPFVCLNCRYRYNCPVSDSPCGGEVILWRFSLAHLSLILAMLCDTVIDSNILISQHATNYLTKLILQYPRSSEMLDHIKAASHALQKWELWVHKGEHVTYPSEDEQEDTIDDRIGKIGLSTKARFLVASLTWIYILNANFPSGPNSPSAPNSPNSQSAPNSPSAVDCEGNPNIIEQLRANYPLLLGKPKKKPFSFNNDDPEDE